MGGTDPFAEMESMFSTVGGLPMEMVAADGDPADDPFAALMGLYGAEEVAAPVLDTVLASPTLPAQDRGTAACEAAQVNLSSNDESVNELQSMMHSDEEPRPQLELEPEHGPEQRAEAAEARAQAQALVLEVDTSLAPQPEAEPAPESASVAMTAGHEPEPEPEPEPELVLALETEAESSPLQLAELPGLAPDANLAGPCAEQGQGEGASCALETHDLLEVQKPAYTEATKGTSVSAENLLAVLNSGLHLSPTARNYQTSSTTTREGDDNLLPIDHPSVAFNNALEAEPSSKHELHAQEDDLYADMAAMFAKAPTSGCDDDATAVPTRDFVFCREPEREPDQERPMEAELELESMRPEVVTEIESEPRGDFQHEAEYERKAAGLGSASGLASQNVPGDAGKEVETVVQRRKREQGRHITDQKASVQSHPLPQQSDRAAVWNRLSQSGRKLSTPPTIHQSAFGVTEPTTVRALEMTGEERRASRSLFAQRVEKAKKQAALVTQSSVSVRLATPTRVVEHPFSPGLVKAVAPLSIEAEKRLYQHTRGQKAAAKERELPKTANSVAQLSSEAEKRLYQPTRGQKVAAQERKMLNEAMEVARRARLSTTPQRRRELDGEVEDRLYRKGMKKMLARRQAEVAQAAAMRAELEKQVARSMFVRRPKPSKNNKTLHVSCIVHCDVSRLLGDATVALPPTLQVKWLHMVREEMVETVADLSFLVPDRQALGRLLNSEPHRSAEADALWVALETAIERRSVEEGEPERRTDRATALPRVASLSHPSLNRNAVQKSWIDREREARSFSTRTPKFAGPRKTERGLDHQVISPTRRRRDGSLSAERQTEANSASIDSSSGGGGGGGGGGSVLPASPILSGISSVSSLASATPSAFSMAVSFANNRQNLSPAGDLNAAHARRGSSAPRNLHRASASGKAEPQTRQESPPWDSRNPSYRARSSATEAEAAPVALSVAARRTKQMLSLYSDRLAELEHAHVVSGSSTTIMRPPQRGISPPEAPVVLGSTMLAQKLRRGVVAGLGSIIIGGGPLKESGNATAPNQIGRMHASATDMYLSFRRMRFVLCFA